jgi:hypothetical protein
MLDPTEVLRRQMLAEINSRPKSRQELESQYGQVWDADELGEAFEVLGFGAPFVVVRRRSDGQVGSLAFQDHPRAYFDFVPDRPQSAEST